MRIVAESVKMTPQCLTGADAAKFIAGKARICYQSTGKGYVGLCRELIRRRHLGLLEHIVCSIEFVTDRQIGNEMVRHRLGSFAQESTRWIKYNGLKVLDCSNYFKNYASVNVWTGVSQACEKAYNDLIELGEPPEMAAKVLPLGLATHINSTFNLRQWREVMEKRLLGKTGRPHPMFQYLMAKALFELMSVYPIFFEDIAREFSGQVLSDPFLQTLRDRIGNTYFREDKDNEIQAARA